MLEKDKALFLKWGQAEIEQTKIFNKLSKIDLKCSCGGNQPFKPLFKSKRNKLINEFYQCRDCLQIVKIALKG